MWTLVDILVHLSHPERQGRARLTSANGCFILRPTPPVNMRPVVFDLDLTLIHGEALDWHIWLGAVSAALGVTVGPNEDWAAHPVHTDHGLLESLSWSRRGRAFEPEERLVFEADLLARLDAALAPGAFLPIAGAPALLDALAGRVSLATGNLHAVTTRKLRCSGLDRVLHPVGARRVWPCSCSEPGIDRAELVRRALQRIGWNRGPATSLGDGVWDVRAARALGVGFIGVAQTDAQEALLRAAGARRVLRDYQDRERILAWIDEAEVPADPRLGVTSG